jgi:hypothetical protein
MSKLAQQICLQPSRSVIRVTHCKRGQACSQWHAHCKMLQLWLLTGCHQAMYMYMCGH